MDELLLADAKIRKAMVKVFKTIDLLKEDAVDDAEQLSESCLDLVKYDFSWPMLPKPLEKALADCKDNMLKAALEKAQEALQEFLVVYEKHLAQ